MAGQRESDQHTFFNEGVSPAPEIPTEIPTLPAESDHNVAVHPEIRVQRTRTIPNPNQLGEDDVQPGPPVVVSSSDEDARRGTLSADESGPDHPGANASFTSLPGSRKKSDANRSAHRLRGSGSRQRLGHIQDNISQHHFRMNTNPEQAPMDARLPITYVFRRPKARYLDYDHKIYRIHADGSIILADFGHGHEIAAGVNNPNDVSNETQHHLINVSRERLDLFIDLMWVGIISEIAEIFFKGSFKETADVSETFAEFLLVFLPSWSFWLRMQYFLNNYFMDDFAQRMIIVWMLVLALIWGNNTPTILTDGHANGQWLICCYIVGVSTLKAIEAVYCFYIPWIRRQFIVETLLFVPAGVLWIMAASFSSLSIRYAFMIAAVCYEYVYGFGLNSPIGVALVAGTFRKAQDRRRIVERYGAFFLLALGEGVFLLVRSAPLGPGLTSAAGAGVMAFIIYFFIALTYFRGDNSKRVIHAQNRSWWIQNIWTIVHVPLFCALVLLSAGVLYLIQYERYGPDPSLDASATGTVTERSSTAGFSLLRRVPSVDDADLSPAVFRVAYETVYGSLATIYFSTGVLALLNHSIDAPRELIIANRWLRIVPRFAAVVIFATLWLYNFHSPAVVMGWALLITWAVYIIEDIAGMERWPRFFESKGHYPVTPDVTDIESGSEGNEKMHRMHSMPF